MLTQIKNLFRAHTKTVATIFLVGAVGIGAIGATVYPSLAFKVRAWQERMTGPSCTPLPFDSLYMTNKITLYLRDHAKAHGNYSGCIPQKDDCLDDDNVWKPDQLLKDADKQYKERFLKPLPDTLTANGLKNALLAVFKYRNQLYSRSLSRENSNFSACSVPQINIVKYDDFEATKLVSPYQMKIQVDVQRIMIQGRNFFLVTFYAYQLAKNNGLEIKVSTWNSPWLVMETVKPEEIMYELYSTMPINASLFNIDTGTYPYNFKSF